MKGNIACFVVCLLSAIMIQGKVLFEKYVNDYVDRAFAQLATVVTTAGLVGYKNFTRPDNVGGNTIIVDKFSLGYVYGLNHLEREKDCNVNERRKDYAVSCPVSFTELKCRLPATDTTTYVLLNVEAKGKLHFRLLKWDKDVRAFILVLPEIKYTVSLGNSTTNDDIIGMQPDVPAAYNPKGPNIPGLYTEALRVFLTQGDLISRLEKAFRDTFPIIKDKIK
uniref:Putative secreted peptide n=1 Tax=Rhipicephalus pulchellus TaxID=72859 RepID=L7M9U2_RHIPC